MKRLLCHIVICLLGVVVLYSAVGAATQYTICDLGTLGGDSSWASGINNFGQVVGYANGSDDVNRAFLWQNGDMTCLGNNVDGNSMARRINDDGTAAGFEGYTPDYPYAQLWHDGVQEELDFGGAYCTANDINESNQVVGWANGQAFLWQSGEVTNLGFLSEYCYSHAMAINESGQIVGDSYIANGRKHAFLWENDTMSDIDTSDSSESTANDINDSGQVTGYLWNANTGLGSAFLWQNGAMTTLGTQSGSESAGLAINNPGQIVGWVNTEYGMCASIWQDGVMQNLNDLIPTNSCWTLCQANDINDFGQVVGYGIYNGSSRAFLLTPVPEPSSVVALGFGLVPLITAAVKRRRRNS